MKNFKNSIFSVSQKINVFYVPFLKLSIISVDFAKCQMLDFCTGFFLNIAIAHHKRIQLLQQPTAGPSGGFNFSATAPPAFNPDVQPSFNFTSGSSISFS